VAARDTAARHEERAIIPGLQRAERNPARQLAGRKTQAWTSRGLAQFDGPGRDGDLIRKLRAAFDEWIRVEINKMEEVYHFQPLTMTFCLDCHRNPAAKLRPPDKITDLDFKWNDDPEKNAVQQKLKGEAYMHDWKVESLQNCSACHR